MSMKDGFIRVAAATPKICVADCMYNEEQMENNIRQAAGKGAKLIVFPELCLTGYTCGDLFLQRSLLDGAAAALEELIRFSKNEDMVIVAGLPVSIGQKLYNVAAIVQKGVLLGLVPKNEYTKLFGIL